MHTSTDSGRCCVWLLTALICGSLCRLTIPHKHCKCPEKGILSVCNRQHKVNGRYILSIRLYVPLLVSLCVCLNAEILAIAIERDIKFVMKISVYAAHVKLLANMVALPLAPDNPDNLLYLFVFIFC